MGAKGENSTSTNLRASSDVAAATGNPNDRNGGKYGGTMFAIGCSLDFSNPTDLSYPGVNTVDIDRVTKYLLGPADASPASSDVVDGKSVQPSPSSFVSVQGKDTDPGKPLPDKLIVRDPRCGEYAV